MDKLTQKQYDFTINYIKNGFNAYQAALSAGYSPTYSNIHAHKMLEHPIVKKHIQKAYQKLDRKIDITVEWKAKKLKRIVDNILPDDGSPDLVACYKDAIKAINELNKMQGDYAVTKTLNVTVDETKGRLIDARKIYEEY